MVKWTKPARDDLKAIYEYIAKDSNFYAKHTITKIVDHTTRMLQNPQIGRVVPELNDQNIREIFTYSYRIIYQVKGEMVFILAVVHGYRDMSSLNIIEL